MEIEEYLRGCRCDGPSASLRRRVLAAARPWRPWYLAAAVAVILVCAGVNAWSAARFERSFGGPPGAAPALAGPSSGGVIVAGPAGTRTDSLISLWRELKEDWP